MNDGEVEVFKVSYLQSFIGFIENDPVIQQFFKSDKCNLLADSYLLAMTFAYFIRAKVTVDQFCSFNFFTALYIAHDMEEDELLLKQNLCNWVSHSWEQFYANRKLFLWKMDFRACVSREMCEKVMNISETEDSSLWKRERRSDHGGAFRRKFRGHITCDECKGDDFDDRMSRYYQPYGEYLTLTESDSDEMSSETDDWESLTEEEDPQNLNSPSLICNNNNEVSKDTKPQKSSNEKNSENVISENFNTHLEESKNKEFPRELKDEKHSQNSKLTNKLEVSKDEHHSQTASYEKNEHSSETADWTVGSNYTDVNATNKRTQSPSMLTGTPVLIDLVHIDSTRESPEKTIPSKVIDQVENKTNENQHDIVGLANSEPKRNPFDLPMDEEITALVGFGLDKNNESKSINKNNNTCTLSQNEKKDAFDELIPVLDKDIKSQMANKEKLPLTSVETNKSPDILFYKKDEKKRKSYQSDANKKHPQREQNTYKEQPRKVKKCTQDTKGSKSKNITDNKLPSGACMSRQIEQIIEILDKEIDVFHQTEYSTFNHPDNMKCKTTNMDENYKQTRMIENYRTLDCTKRPVKDKIVVRRKANAFKMENKELHLKQEKRKTHSQKKHMSQDYAERKKINNTVAKSRKKCTPHSKAQKPKIFEPKNVAQKVQTTLSVDETTENIENEVDNIIPNSNKEISQDYQKTAKKILENKLEYKGSKITDVSTECKNPKEASLDNPGNSELVSSKAKAETLTKKIITSNNLKTEKRILDGQNKTELNYTSKNTRDETMNDGQNNVQKMVVVRTTKHVNIDSSEVVEITKPISENKVKQLTNQDNVKHKNDLMKINNIFQQKLKLTQESHGNLIMKFPAATRGRQIKAFTPSLIAELKADQVRMQKRIESKFGILRPASNNKEIVTDVKTSRGVTKVKDTMDVDDNNNIVDEKQMLNQKNNNIIENSVPELRVRSIPPSNTDTTQGGIEISNEKQDNPKRVGTNDYLMSVNNEITAIHCKEINNTPTLDNTKSAVVLRNMNITSPLMPLLSTFTEMKDLLIQNRNEISQLNEKMNNLENQISHKRKIQWQDNLNPEKMQKLEQEVIVIDEDLAERVEVRDNQVTLNENNFEDDEVIIIKENIVTSRNIQMIRCSNVNEKNDANEMIITRTIKREKNSQEIESVEGRNSSKTDFEEIIPGKSDTEKKIQPAQFSCNSISLGVPTTHSDIQCISHSKHVKSTTKHISINITEDPQTKEKFLHLKIKSTRHCRKLLPTL
uniref:Speedy protein A n=1 Tax=Cacopsylla melanoneura TaxID=428564 RepID=A0A8D9E7C9_9HEMI